MLPVSNLLSRRSLTTTAATDSPSSRTASTPAPPATGGATVSPLVPASSGVQPLAAAATGEIDLTLSALPIGQCATVRGYGTSLEPRVARRLFDLGFAPGALVEAIRRAPLGDPTIFRVADCEIALRRAQASQIRLVWPS